MTREQAQRILLAYRLGETAGWDPQLEEALETARQDEALMAWLEQELEADRLVRVRLREIDPPAGLRERILRAPKIISVPWWRTPTTLAATAALALLVGMSSWWLSTRSGTTARSTALNSHPTGTARGEVRFDTFRKAMVDFVASGAYRLELQSDSLAEVKRFLATRRAGPGALPRALEELATYGCQVFDWQGSRVTLICFQTEGVGIAHLFIVDAAPFADPPSSTTAIGPVESWSAATWRVGERVFLLCAAADEPGLRRLIDG